MNYKQHYDRLISRAKNRVLDCYIERHHVVPRCMGGSDDDSNLADLTPEEHYVAHQLLMKIYPDIHALAKASHMMIPNRPNNKMYGWVRRRFSKAKSIEQLGSGNSQYGTKWIHNPVTGESKKIRGKVLDGWVAGSKPKKVYQKKQRVYVDPVKRKNETDLYREYYRIYCSVGFNAFVEQTEYKYSKSNLVQRFKTLLPEFVPQNGKKRYFIPQ